MIPTKKQCIEQNISNKRIKQKNGKIDAGGDCWSFIHLEKYNLF